MDRDRAQQLGRFRKAAGVKKGMIMKSPRAALLGRMQGPDLLTTWGLLARIGEDSAQAASLSQRTLSRVHPAIQSSQEHAPAVEPSALQADSHQDRQEHQTLEAASTEDAGLLETDRKKERPRRR